MTNAEQRRYASRASLSVSRLWRATATYLLLPVFSIGLMLGVFEVVLRLAGYEAIYEIYSKPSIFWEYDDLLGWKHQPGASGTYVGPRPWPIEFRTTVEIDSLGLRGPEVAAREPDELRALVLGDSMVAAFEVSYEDTFVARMERSLTQRLGRPVRALNAGVRGYGTDQSLLYFRERGWRLEPDLVILYHSGNDPVDNTTLHEMRRPFGKAALALTENGGLEQVGVPVPRYEPCSEFLLLPTSEVARMDTVAGRALCRAQMALLDHSALFSFLTLAIPWDQSLLKRLYYLGNPHADQLARDRKSDPAVRYSVELTSAILLELAAESRNRGADFMLIGDPKPLAALDLALLNENGVEVVSLADIVADRREISWKNDGHFNPEGHRRVALLLTDHAERRLRDALERRSLSLAAPARPSSR